MCTNQRLIFPKYSRFPMYVKCGKCPACLQEKAAHRVRRIKDTYQNDLVCFLVTLTYSRGTSPYVDREEAYQFCLGNTEYLNVYRDCHIRKVRKPSNWNDYNQVYKRVNTRVVLTTIPRSGHSSMKNTKDMKHEHNKISVCFYKDFQHFAARLRLNLKRHYDYEFPIKMYACSEYGTASDRTHYHIALFGRKSDKEILRSAVFESWPFSDLSRFKRAFEEAYRASSYVASYVNQPSRFPKFLKDYFAPKHSYSKGFGLGNVEFELSKILSKIERGFVAYDTIKNRNGFPVTVTVPIPSYVINRYFPKFKGYTRYPPSEVVSNLERIGRFNYDEFCDAVTPLYLSKEEFYKVNVRLHNAYKRYIVNVPDGYDKTFEGYYKMHQAAWNAYNSTVLRLHMENQDIPLLEKFDNLDVVISRKIKSPGIDISKIKETDPNKFRSTIRNTWNFTASYHDNIKHRVVSNDIYQMIDSECEL